MAKAVLASRAQVEKLRSEFVAERETRRRNLERIAFGIVGEPTAFDLMAMRDAQDRAAKISTAEDECGQAEKKLEWKSTVNLAEGIQRTIRWLCATVEPEPPALHEFGHRVFHMRTAPTIDPSTLIDESPANTTTSISPEATCRLRCKGPVK